MMKRVSLPKLILALSSGLTLFFGVGVGHTLAAATTMQGMMSQKMPTGQCQSSCTPQSSTTLAIQKSDIELDKDKEPRPAEPYYLAFMGVGWTTVITLAAAYLFGYLRWRPPDLYKLNVAYRF